MKRGGPLRRSTAKPKAARYTGPPTALRHQVLERDDWTCARCGLTVDGKPYSLQHRLPRGRGGANTLANLVTLCGDATNPDYCHSHVEQFRQRATREGWLVPTGIRPEDWPVLRFGQAWEMPGKDWVEVEPHPMQIGDKAA
jgi:hypothetical protein